ncbi:MAG: cereblon family protein [Gammaproteobacteria bacterium]
MRSTPDMDMTIPWYCFDAASSDLDEVVKELSKPSDTGKGRKIRCRSCRHIITDDDQRISVHGSHTHNRSNPGGISFHFGCFQNAQGCSVFGSATAEYTWFTGYKWQIVLCRGCAEHLGWLFKGESSFYGLITARLTSDEDNSGG